MAASPEVAELDRRIAAFQASLVALETEITEQEALCTTIQSRIAGATGKQQVYDDALAAVRVAPRSTEDERAERRSLREDADEARADLVMTQELLQGAKSTLVSLQTRKDTLMQHVHENGNRDVPHTHLPGVHPGGGTRAAEGGGCGV